jgi:hypothetical protein
MRVSVRLERSVEKGQALLFIVLLACSSPTSRSTSSATASASAAPSAQTSARASPVAIPETGDTKKARALLVDGRKLEKDQHWKEALPLLIEASALAPDDVNILAELGWTALHAGDLDTAKRASDRALELTTDGHVRAQILYNLGRVAEAKDDKPGAKELYEKSLALRPSKNVEERLEGLGGQAPAAAPPPELPCNRTFPNTAALCGCLSKSPDSCGTDKDAPTSESGELEIVKTTTETDGETLFLLVANDKGGVRPVAELGRDYHPGSFGIDNGAKVLGIDEQKLGDRRIAVVRTEVTDKDENNGGIEVMTVHTVASTICTLRTAKTATLCPLTVPTEIDDTHAFPHPAESLSADDKAYIDAHAKEAHERHMRLTVKLSAKGDVLVTLEKGDEKNVPKGILGHHALF